MKPIKNTTNLPGLAPMYYSGTTNFYSGSGNISLGTLSQISFQAQNPWTIEIWIYLDALVDTMNIVSRAGEFQFQTQGGNIWVARTNQAMPLVAYDVLQEHTWYYVAITFDGASMNLYVNGVPVTQVSVSDQGVAPTGNPMLIGSGFYGQLSSCRFWNIALNSQSVSNNQWNLYPAGTTGLVTQLDFTKNPPVDSSGNNIQPVLKGGVNFYNFAPAIKFQGNGFVDPYYDESVNPAGAQADCSILAWIYPALLGNNMFIFANGPQESNYGLTLSLTAAGNVALQIGDSPILQSNTQLSVTQWYHVAATWVASTNTGIIYINGVQDATASNMHLNGTSTAGMPLIGAIPSITSHLPIASFQGCIQNINIWNKALAAADISTYMRTDPQSVDGCIADYDLTGLPPQNLVSLNPVGMVAGADLTSHSFSTGNTGVQDPIQPTANLFSDEITEAADENFVALHSQQFKEFLETQGLPDAVKQQLSALHDDNLRRGFIDLGNGKLPRAEIIHIDANTRRLVLHIDGRQEIAYEGDFSECIIWMCTLVAYIGSALFTAFGFALNYTQWVNGYVTFLGTRINGIGLSRQLMAIFNGGVNSNSIYAALKLLQEYSLLMPLAKLSWKLLARSVDIWTILSVGTRILLIISPMASVEVVWFLAQLAYSVYEVVEQWNKRPANCP